jgi:hypothetical protein
MRAFMARRKVNQIRIQYYHSHNAPGHQGEDYENINVQVSGSLFCLC